MTGWGRVPVLLGLGVSLAVGCGGRTGALEGEYGASGNSNGAEGGAAGAGVQPRAGAASRGGSMAVGGFGEGATTNGGYATAGANYGGATYGGVSSGGYGFAGSFPVAGFYTGGFAAGGAFAAGGTFAGGGTGSVDCQACVLQSCGPQLNKCLGDLGCLAILACVTTRGCQGFQCYGAQYCKDVIDQFGGLGGSALSEVLQSLTCALNSGCQCG